VPKSKVVTAQQAAELIRDGDTIAISAFAAGAGLAEEVCAAIEKRFLDTGKPNELTVMVASGNGDGTVGPFANNHFAHPQMLSRVIAGHVGLSKRFANMIAENNVAAWNFPQGVITHLYRAAAGRKPGVLTHVGLETFADPRLEGGKMNPAATEDLVELVTVNGEDKLLYKTIPITVGLIRGTTADEQGNLTMEREALIPEALHVAQAAKNSGGIVIAQVERLAKRGTLNAMSVQVPGIMVDYIVMAQPGSQKMNIIVDYNPSYSGEVKVPLDAIPPMKMDIRKVMAKRCALELRADQIINLGIGVPEGVAGIALEEGVNEQLYLTIESGVIGGVPAPGLSIGAASNAEAIIPHPSIFDFYDGGGLDLAFLGLAQIDRNGNINVSKFNGRMVGCGGFVNITQNAKSVVFCGSFTAGRSKIEITGDGIAIIEDAPGIKFVEQVEQITFSGNYARRIGQPVLYVTERAVFRLSDSGVELVEVAPGVDLERDVLGKMEFKPAISPTLKLMDAKLFKDAVMHLKESFG